MEHEGEDAEPFHDPLDQSAGRTLVNATPPMETAPAEVAWGIAGTGHISHDFATALRHTPGAMLAAVAGRSQRRAHQFAATHGVARAYEGYHQLAEDPAVQVVYVGVVHSEHYALAKQLLLAGKHVLCEKPMTLTAWQTAELMALAKERRRLLAEGLWTRFFPAVARARQLLAEGAVGRVHTVYSTFGFRADPAANPHRRRLFDNKLGGGGLLEIGLYPVSMAMLAFGPSMPTAISAAGVTAPSPEDEATVTLLQRLLPPRVDLSAGVALRYGEDRLAVISYDLQVDTPEETIFMGTEGGIKIQHPMHCPEQLTITRLDKEGLDAETTQETFPLPETDEPFVYQNSVGLSFEAAAVHRAILDGELELAEFTHKESATLAAIMDEVRRQLGVRYPPDRPPKVLSAALLLAVPIATRLLLGFLSDGSNSRSSSKGDSVVASRKAPPPPAKVGPAKADKSEPEEASAPSSAATWAPLSGPKKLFADSYKVLTMGDSSASDTSGGQPSTAAPAAVKGETRPGNESGSGAADPPDQSSGGASVREAASQSWSAPESLPVRSGRSQSSEGDSGNARSAKGKAASSEQNPAELLPPPEHRGEQVKQAVGGLLSAMGTQAQKLRASADASREELLGKSREGLEAVKETITATAEEVSSQEWVGKSRQRLEAARDRSKEGLQAVKETVTHKAEELQPDVLLAKSREQLEAARDRSRESLQAVKETISQKAEVLQPESLLAASRERLDIVKDKSIEGLDAVKGKIHETADDLQNRDWLEKPRERLQLAKDVSGKVAQQINKLIHGTNGKPED